MGSIRTSSAPTSSPLTPAPLLPLLVLQENPFLILKTSCQKPSTTAFNPAETSTISRTTSISRQPGNIHRQQQRYTPNLTEPKSYNTVPSCTTGIYPCLPWRLEFRNDDGECDTRAQNAQHAHGDMYRNSDEVPQDYYQAMTWYLKAAK
ncbi:hypothetical protein KI688_001175 [Linnemannia hyalina]|uniref:Uncharacterized protein n=1 Tax=Linnemannia hyalina TaxID=64524 RepID=A0A9P7Y5M9_9FUNG|nr:hypothetical protein KI688_001175 [Linnemannia hyalina]